MEKVCSECAFIVNKIMSQSRTCDVIFFFITRKLDCVNRIIKSNCAIEAILKI